MPPSKQLPNKIRAIAIALKPIGKTENKTIVATVDRVPVIGKYMDFSPYQPAQNINSPYYRTHLMLQLNGFCKHAQLGLKAFLKTSTP
jgi:hypothetical protein